MGAVEIDTKAWERLGATSNTQYYAVETGIIAAVPNLGSVDDRKSAVENVELQDAHWHEIGRGGVVLVYFDRMVNQTKEARQAYGTLHDLTVMRASALIGGSVLGRTIISFFLGLFKPQVPVKMFGTTESALVWSREMNRIADARRAAA